MLLEWRRAVQILSPPACKVLATLCAIVAASVLAGNSAAWATVPPDLSGSTLRCSDANGGVLLAGDELTCALAVVMAAGTESAEVSATVVLSDVIESATVTPPGTYDSVSRTISFGPTVLGRMFAAERRTVQFQVTIAPGLTVDTDIALTADVQAIGDIDQAEVHQPVNSNVLTISPPAADLLDSTLSCVDANGGQLWPGDSVSCDLDVVNGVGHEAAVSVTASLVALGGTWVSGGTPNGFGGTAFGASVLGDIPPGDSKSVGAIFKVPSTSVGGDIVSPAAFITGSSSPSLVPIRLSRTHAALVVSPGPAVLVASSLVCFDTDAGLLLEGDDITCIVNVKPQAGYEGVDDATAVIGIPDGTEYASGGDDHDANSITLGSPSLGHVDPGAAMSSTFHLTVTGAPGVILRPAGTLTATSVPFGGAVSQGLSALPLLVDEPPPAPPAPLGPQPIEPETLTPVAPAPAVAASKSYTLRAKTIRIKLRRGHRRKSHLWKGSKRRTVFVKRYVVRTPKISGKVVKKVLVPKKGKNGPKRGKVRIKGTRLIYTVKKGKRRTDRFRYTVTDTAGKKATGKVIVTWEKMKKKK